MRDVAFENIGKAMPGIMPSVIAQDINKKLADGSISTTEYAEYQRGLAQSMFPTDPPAAAFSKFLASSVGRDMVASYNRAHYERLQRSSAVGNGIAKDMCEMDEGEPHPDVDDPDEALKALGKAYWRKLGGGMTLEQATDFVARKTETGRALVRQSTQKSLAKYY